MYFQILQIIYLIGENGDEAINKDVCGAVVSVRQRGNRLALWTATSKTNVPLVQTIGHQLKNSLTLSLGQNMEYNLHSETSNKRGSSVRALCTMQLH